MSWLDLFLNPSKFLNINKDIGYPIPLLLIFTATSLSTVGAIITAPISAKLIESNLIGSGLPEEQLETILSLIHFLSIIGPPIGLIVSWIVLVALLYGLSIPFGGTGEFSRLLKLTTFSFLPFIILYPINFYINFEILKGLSSHLNVSILKFSSLIVLISTCAWQYIYLVFAVKVARNLTLKNSCIVCSVPILIYITLAFLQLL